MHFDREALSRLEVEELAMTLFDRLSQRTCSTCRLWRRTALIATEAGYLEAQCLQPASPLHHTIRRGSDRCSLWEQRGSEADLLPPLRPPPRPKGRGP
jgi:hypothetical protein